MATTLMTSSEARYEIMQSLVADFPAMPVTKRSDVINAIIDRTDTNTHGDLFVDSLNKNYETIFNRIHKQLSAKA